MDDLRLGTRAVAEPAAAVAPRDDRVASIDAFRGLTIVLMIVVNELAGVAGVPAWLRHMPADADAMTIVDAVFPAFLFIVGLSMPVAFARRRERGEGWFGTQRHVAVRTFALVVLGVFMVNGESGYNEHAMPLPIAAWSLLFYAAAIAVWNGGFKLSPRATAWLRTMGALTLVVLALVWRGGADGSARLTPQWWGILGLIGWAYLIASVAYQLASGRAFGLGVAVGVCIALATAGMLPAHMVHAAIVLCGAATASLMPGRDGGARWPQAGLFAALLLGAGAALRPGWGISKIHATPTWALWSAAGCVLAYVLLNRLARHKPFAAWTGWLEPAATNPLLAYMLPYIVFATMQLSGWSWPHALRTGLPGMLWTVAYALLVLAAVGGLNRLNIRLKL